MLSNQEIRMNKEKKKPKLYHPEINTVGICEPSTHLPMHNTDER